MMGVLPWSIWGKTVPTDDRRRKMLSLNLLLIRSKSRIILVDTGLGNRFLGKQRDIYNPTEFELPISLAALGIRDIDVTDVIMTHLHFDHAGGIVTSFADKDRLTFPMARYHIQRSEWEVAKNPDGLNRAAYNFEHQLLLLEQDGDINLIDDEAELYPGIKVKRVGGHTVGSQIVEIDTDDGFYIYAGDVIPTMFHTSPAITSAYDVCRKDTFKAKQYIYALLKEKQGFLLLDHDNDKWAIPVNELHI